MFQGFVYNLVLMFSGVSHLTTSLLFGVSSVAFGLRNILS